RRRLHRGGGDGWCAGGQRGARPAPLGRGARQLARRGARVRRWGAALTGLAGPQGEEPAGAARDGDRSWPGPDDPGRRLARAVADSFLAAFPASQAVAGWRGDGREVRSWGRPRQPRGPLEEVGAQLADLVELLHDLAGEVDEVARSLLEAAAPEAFASFRLELGPLAPGRSLGADL